MKSSYRGVGDARKGNRSENTCGNSWRGYHAEQGLENGATLLQPSAMSKNALYQGMNMENASDPLRNTRFIPRVTFLLIFILYVVTLSLRPIPDQLSTNDLGRYLAEFDDFNSLPWPHAYSGDVSRFLFFTLMKPAGWLESPRFFMFTSAITLPIAFLLFGRWSKGGILWALAALFCLAGFDLQTNALRQGLSVFVLLFALRLALSNFMVLGITVGVISCFFHSSNIEFLPLLMILAYLKYRKVTNRRLKAHFQLMFVTVFGIGALLLFIYNELFLDLISLYQQFYVEAKSPAFNFFISVPILYVFLVRKCVFPQKVTLIETITFTYSASLICATLIFFPAIAYRFTLTSCILQIFVSMNANNSSIQQGFLTFVGLFVHLLMTLAISASIRSVILTSSNREMEPLHMVLPTAKETTALRFIPPQTLERLVRAIHNPTFKTMVFEGCKIDPLVRTVDQVLRTKSSRARPLSAD